MKKFLICIYFCFIIFLAICPAKAQGYINIPIPGPKLPTYSPEKIHEYLKERVDFKPKGIEITARSYCLNKNRMANGERPHPGAIATDKTWPLGTTVRLWHEGKDLGIFKVADRGDAVIVGNNIDMWASSCQRSFAFGKRKLIMQILYRPEKDISLYNKKVRVRKRVKPNIAVFN